MRLSALLDFEIGSFTLTSLELRIRRERESSKVRAKQEPKYSLWSHYNNTKTCSMWVDSRLANKIYLALIRLTVNMVQTRPLFRLFLSFPDSNINFNNTNWKKSRWCAWDLNLGPQDGVHRHNHRAMAAAQYFLYLKLILPRFMCPSSSCNFNLP